MKYAIQSKSIVTSTMQLISDIVGDLEGDTLELYITKRDLERRTFNVSQGMLVASAEAVYTVRDYSFREKRPKNLILKIEETQA